MLRRERSAPIVRCEGGVDRGWTGGKAPQQYLGVSGDHFSGQREPVVRDVFHHVISGSLLCLYVTVHRRILVGVEPLPATPPRR